MAQITQAQIDAAGKKIGAIGAKLIDKVSNREQVTEMVMDAIGAFTIIGEADIPEPLRVAVGSRMFHAAHGEFNERELPLTLPAAAPTPVP